MSDVELVVQDDIPNLSFSLDLFKKKYLPGKFLLADKDKFSLSRYVTLEIQNDVCFFKINSLDSLYWSVMPVANTKVPDGKYIIEYDLLLSVLDYIQGDTLRLNFAGDSFNITVLEGVVPLLCHTFDRGFCDKVTDDYNFKDFKVSENFKTLLSLGAVSMSLANKPENKKIRVSEGSAYAFFTDSLFKFPFNFPVSLRGVDLRFLDALFTVNPELELVGINVGKEYVNLSFDDIVVSFQKIKTDDLLFVEKEFNSIQQGCPVVSLDLSDFQKKISLMSNIIGRSEFVNFQSISNELFLKVVTRNKKDLSFKLDIINETDKLAPVFPDYIISLPIQSLISLMSLIKNQTFINAFIDNQQRLVFSIDNLFEIIFAKSV